MKATSAVRKAEPEAPESWQEQYLSGLRTTIIPTVAAEVEAGKAAGQEVDRLKARLKDLDIDIERASGKLAEAEAAALTNAEGMAAYQSVKAKVETLAELEKRLREDAIPKAEQSLKEAGERLAAAIKMALWRARREEQKALEPIFAEMIGRDRAFTSAAGDFLREVSGEIGRSAGVAPHDFRLLADSDTIRLESFFLDLNRPAPVREEPAEPVPEPARERPRLDDADLCPKCKGERRTSRLRWLGRELGEDNVVMDVFGCDNCQYATRRVAGKEHQRWMK